MNWKDYPQLFANGKFKCTYTDYFGGKRESDFDGLNMYCFNSVEEYELIARPISDMTDEELWVIIDMHFSGVRGKDYSDDPVFLEEWRYSGLDWIVSKNRWDFKIYLLSIGVYPFDDDTDVIYK